MKFNILVFILCLLSASVFSQVPDSLLVRASIPIYTYNTFVGRLAGKYVSSGSYNFVVGEDSTAVNIAGDTSYIWYIQPDAKYFNQCPDCLKCFLLAYPHVSALLPEDRALKIIEKARKCLPDFYYIRD